MNVQWLLPPLVEAPSQSLSDTSFSSSSSGLRSDSLCRSEAVLRKLWKTPGEQPVEMDQRALEAGKRRASCCLHGRQSDKTDLQRTKIWTETETELDSLHATLKPRRSRLSFCLPTASHSPPKLPTDAKPAKVYCLLPWVEKPKKQSPEPSCKLFINLPKLPFGKHSSYNEEPNFRKLIVSKRGKAWRRYKKPRRRQSLSDLNETVG